MPFNEERVSWPHRGHLYCPSACQTTVKYYGSIFGETNILATTLTAVASQLWRPTRLATLAEANAARVSLATLANPAPSQPVIATGIARYARESLRSPKPTRCAPPFGRRLRIMRSLCVSSRPLHAHRRGAFCGVALAPARHARLRSLFAPLAV